MAPLGRPESVQTFRLTTTATGALAPIWQSVDPSRIGGVLLLTSACEAQVEKDLGLARKKKKIRGVNEDDKLQADELFVPGGGAYRAESVGKYVKQAMLGGRLLADALVQAGVPESAMRFEHFEGRDDHPIDIVQSFFASLPRLHPDGILYYSGPTDAEGRFALGWTNNYGFSRSAFLGPEDIMPPRGPADGPIGNRSFIIEASNTARWLQPTPRTMGFAAWEGNAVFGNSTGPPLVRWLLGDAPTLPRNALFCPLAESRGSRDGSHGLLALPAYEALFWGFAPEPGAEAAKVATSLLWELDVFTAPARGSPDQIAACEEVLCRGGAHILCDILKSHAQESSEQEALLLQILRILHRLVILSREERWLGSMGEVLATALSTIALAGCPATLYAAALALATACMSVCESARQEACNKYWDEIQHVLESSLRGEHGAQSCVSACQLVTQVVSTRPLNHGEDAELLNLLQAALVGQWQPENIAAVQSAAADSLVFASLHCDVVKQQILHNLAHTGHLLPVLREGNAEVVAKILTLLRSLAACEPREVVAEDLAQGTTEAIVEALGTYPDNVTVQRWGLAALGAIAQASSLLASEAVKAGACDCVVWALGADIFVPYREIHREALFCTHSLLRDVGARRIFKAPSSRLSGLISAILFQSLENPAMIGTEVPLWGVRAFERLASSTGGGASAVEPYLDALVHVMLNPGVRDTTALSGACAIAHLTTGSPVANARMQPNRVALQKELQRRALQAADVGNRVLEKEFQDWARVLIDGLGGHHLGGIDEDAGSPPPTPESSETGDEDEPASP